MRKINLKQMIEIGKLLVFGESYSQAGTSFSKALLIGELEQSYFLLVVESEKKVSQYESIFTFLDEKIFKVGSYIDIINLKHNKTGKYISYREVLNIDIGDKNYFSVSTNEHIMIQELTKKLHSFSIPFSEYEEKNSFKVQGDTLRYIDTIGNVIEISFWDETVDAVFINKHPVQNYFFGRNKSIKEDFEMEKIDPHFWKDIPLILDGLDMYELSDVLYKEQRIAFNQIAKAKQSLNIQTLHLQDIDELKKAVEKKEVVFVTKNTTTITNFLENHQLSAEVLSTKLRVLKSFIFTKNQKNVVVICDDIISTIFIKKRRKKNFSEDFDLLMQIKPGDYVVHIDHGVGVFSEIVEKELGGIKREYITISYKNNDTLFVPITEVGRVSKYVGVEHPKLTSLSSRDWEKKLKKVQEDVAHIAEDLLEIYAKRALQTGFAFGDFPEETAKFMQSFEYEYTEDQLLAIEDIYSDMHSDTTMDRLICGDVGFGKTEVAFAAIFKALINEKQAVLISPLVVLAYEHFEKAKARFAELPFNIEVLTRFESAKQTKLVLEKLKTGKVDFVIGTHRLLSEDVVYKDLGLLVIDEEHKFGVQAKEKIKKIRGNIDILALSATPIPRSLNMALSGLKQVSMLQTAPIGKRAIITEISSFNDTLIQEACEREFERDGQVFFIHNRVKTITAMQSYLEKLTGKKVLVTHGQLPGDLLEKRIIAFKKKEFDILLSTTVIENGIDFREVNTIFINDAVNFGISQIHQLRGRVGRGSVQGYCYLLFKKDTIKEEAAKRLKTIMDYSHLGAGFELAIKDLEIRGGGDILGLRQSGSSSEVGLSLFLEMLEDKIESLKNNKISTGKATNNKENNVLKQKVDTKVDIQIEAYIDEKYFSNELDKLQFYREIEQVSDKEEIETIYSDFYDIDRAMPLATENFFSLLRLKLLAAEWSIAEIKQVGLYYHIVFEEGTDSAIVEKFLKHDTEVRFRVVTLTKLRAAKKLFTSSEKFIHYLLEVLSAKKKLKIKLKK